MGNFCATGGSSSSNWCDCHKRATSSASCFSRPGGRAKPWKVCAISSFVCTASKLRGASRQILMSYFFCGGNTCAVAKVCRDTWSNLAQRMFSNPAKEVQPSLGHNRIELNPDALGLSLQFSALSADMVTRVHGCLRASGYCPEGKFH